MSPLVVFLLFDASVVAIALALIGFGLGMLYLGAWWRRVEMGETLKDLAIGFAIWALFRCGIWRREVRDQLIEDGGAFLLTDTGPPEVTGPILRGFRVRLAQKLLAMLRAP